MPRRQRPKRIPPARLHQPTAHECALLVLRLLQAKIDEAGRSVTRARLSELTLRKLWVRSRVTDDLLHDVQEILIHGGWALFWAGASFAVMKLDVVEGWGRISWKRTRRRPKEGEARQIPGVRRARAIVARR